MHAASRLQGVAAMLRPSPFAQRLTAAQAALTWSIAAGVIAALVALGGCGAGRPHDLQVMSYAPQGPIDVAEPISVRFDQPVVGDAQVGKPAVPGVVAIVPAVHYKAFWQDRQTLVVDVTDALAASTRYEVSLAGALGKRTGHFTFGFVHAPLTVDGVWGIDTDDLPPAGDVPLSFNQPVRPRDAAAHCQLATAHGAIALVAKTDAPATNVALHPAHSLVPGAHYTLTCANLAGAGGNATLEKPYSLALRARPLLAVASASPTGNDVAADQATIALTFTTPVALDAVRAAVSSTPRIPGLDAGSLSGDGLTYTVTADLEIQTDYALTVHGLVDTAGQKLAQPFAVHFHTGDARPRLSLERGIFALEASAKGYPVWSRNVRHYTVQCGAIPKRKLVQLLTGDMNYDPWGGNDDDKPIDWKSLGVAPRTAVHTTAARNKWQLDELDLGATCGRAAGARGVYLAEVSSDEITPDPDRAWLTPRKNRVLANVTDLGVLLQTGTASGLVWVTSLATGKPVEGARVTVFTPAGKQVYADLTNADGLVHMPGSAQLLGQPGTGQAADPDAQSEDWDSYRSQRLVATVEKGSDLAVIDGNWANGIQVWNFGLPQDDSGGKLRIRGFIQSDRGLYRPGETVHFKGLVRAIDPAHGPRVPSQTKVAVEVTDSRGQTVKTATAHLSPFGGFAFDMDLTADAALGDYEVAATVAGQVFRETFEVQDFRPAAFEVSLAPKDKAPRRGARLQFSLDARYLFGAPVAGAKVEWHLRRRTHLVQFAGYEDYTFSADPDQWWWAPHVDDYGDEVSDGADATDAQGHLAIASRDDAKADPGPVDYILSANVTDAADQTIGKSVVVTAHDTAFYLGMHANEMVQAVGMPFGVNLVALAPDGTRVATKAHLSFIRTEQTCAWDSVEYRSYEHCDAHPHTMIERDVDIAAGGSHTERIYPTEPGDYVVKVEAKDASGKPVVAESEIWVIGKGDAFWSGDEGDRMTLVASKPRYVPGETARLVPEANLVAPTALVTIERDGILDARVVKMQSASEGIELAIADAWAPNVFASVALVSGRHGPGDQNRPQFKMGMIELDVASQHKQLDVAVALDRAKVRPGDRVSGTIRVTQGGQPVKAEVSLSAADEGVLQLIAYQTPNPMKTFYAPYGLGVDAATNWNRVARLADPEAGDPDEGGDTRSTIHGQRVRSKFVSSAYWAPMLVTDEHGEIRFSFVAPDNLTAYRLMAVAADAGDRFGAGDTRLTVTKPLIAEPALPRFLRSGDTAAVGVVITNHTGHAGTAIVTARATGVRLATTRAAVAIPANGTGRVRFAASAGGGAAATLSFAVALGGERDAVAVTLPIGKPRVIDTRTLVDRTLAAGETWHGALGAAPDVLRGESTLAITVDRSGLGELAPGLHALVAYPYGCLEQTLARLVPMVAAKDLARTLDDPGLRGTKLDQFIAAGVAKVIRHQQGDGLFSLWPQSQTYPQLAALALWGLTVVQQAGVAVPPSVFDGGIKALEQWTDSPDALKPDGSGATVAMAAYVMAMRGSPDSGLDARLYAMRAGLPRWGQAFLLRAMAHAKADPAQIAALEGELAAAIAVKDGRALVHETAGADELELYMDSDVRATAMVLAALLDVDPSSPLVDPLAAGLLAAREPSGAWESTEDDLWSLVALAQYARRAAPGEATVTVTIGGKQVAQRRVIGARVALIRVPYAHLAGDDVAVSVDRGAHVSVRATEARADAGAAVSHGFTVTRSYEDAHGLPATKIRAGDLVTVRLRVTVDADHRWVALVDPIPAGFEIVDPKLATSADADAGSGSGSGASTSSGWGTQAWAFSWDDEELLDDRAEWFADHLPAGTYELTYHARATIAGTFAAAPATAEAMYHPDLHGRSASAAVTIGDGLK